MHRSRQRRFPLRFAAETHDLRLQLRSRFSAALGRRVEKRLQVAALDVLGARAKTFLAVLAGFDQVVQGIDHVVVVHCHLCSPFRLRPRITALIVPTL
jgi:hypothetical protein